MPEAAARRAAVRPRARPRGIHWPPDAPRVGMHLAVRTGLLKTAMRARAIGCRALQIFSDNPTAWRRRESVPPDGEAFVAYCRDEELRPVAIHASYLINLAGSAQPFAEQSRRTLIHEMQRAPLYGATLVNTHIGSHRQGGEEIGLRQIRASVEAVLAESPDGVRLVLENSAGGGDELGRTVEELASILDGVRYGADRLAFCLDTAHLWGVGYDVSTAEGAAAVIDRFDELIGLERLALLHLNDSKAPLGSRWDRHEHVGAGAIGPSGMAALLRDPRLRHITFMLETPGVDEGYDAINMRRARMLYDGSLELPKLPAAAFRLSRRSTRMVRPMPARGAGRRAAAGSSAAGGR